MSKLTSPIDYKSLEQELREALRADEMYKLQNDAKLRAVEQNVPTYEDFRQMVNAAHLKPLQRVDITSKAEGSWNPVANNDNSDTKMTLDQSRSILEDKPLDDQFLRVWKTTTGHREKFNYLKSLRNDLREKIFPVEIPSVLFAELINVCFETVAFGDDNESVIEILSILSKCNRFDLTVCFMEETERETCIRLFHDLLASTPHQDEHLRDAIKLLGLSYEIVLE
ncbi:dynein axonemal assembly factor 19 [Andrena cerasifolii]|uniref:dynein axonemal assembly factor 19 n=1 Tax=Andrena cerasifolii TaxID=2819439 RepID=UPI004037B448